MSRFKTKKSKGTAAINTSSLPDIIFMLLFFFMVTTVMREVSLKVKLKLPEATEIQKLERKSLVSYIYIGPPVKSALYGTNSRIQLNDTFATVDDIQEFVAKEREDRDEADRKFITTSLKIDGITKMGIVTDVKQELRKAGALKINYSTRKGLDKR
ncbi:MAG: biopolymer transporter ExbD [Lentimicrobiaceae bacterium]|jgi:biopolymer transport protein ExbD|nr:biopolymer transporter ExbD [Lentimicrobiaceae bacterium]MDG1902069.1 biopolymer transporter ExbD [Bacteroidales bacterium]MDG2081509.1 biopolymer transporter ExbD [Bacteroidales bacterium]|tara:strand:- start:4740 stop:5207 length:468 start_codon:yes stop_codon:yes gene_type:complete